MFINNATLNFANKIITIDYIDLILSGINDHIMIHVFRKFGNDIQINKDSNDSSKRDKTRH